MRRATSNQRLNEDEEGTRAGDAAKTSPKRYEKLYYSASIGLNTSRGVRKPSKQDLNHQKTKSGNTHVRQFRAKEQELRGSVTKAVHDWKVRWCVCQYRCSRHLTNALPVMRTTARSQPFSKTTSIQHCCYSIHMHSENNQIPMMAQKTHTDCQSIQMHFSD